MTEDVDEPSSDWKYPGGVGEGYLSILGHVRDMVYIYCSSNSAMVSRIIHD